MGLGDRRLSSSDRMVERMGWGGGQSPKGFHRRYRGIGSGESDRGLPQCIQQRSRGRRRRQRKCERNPGGVEGPEGAVVFSQALGKQGKSEVKKSVLVKLNPREDCARTTPRGCEVDWVPGQTLSLTTFKFYFFSPFKKMEHIQKKKRVTPPPPQTIAEKKLDQALWALPPELQDMIAAWHYHTNGISAVHYCKRKKPKPGDDIDFACLNFWLCEKEMKRDEMCRVCYHIVESFHLVKE